MSYPTRYQENRGILSEQQLNELQHKRVLLVGCGGIGGNVANQLIRLGIIHITLVDYDQFDESNLNRQLFTTLKTIGANKVDTVKNELLQINPSCDITIYKDKIEQVSSSIFSSHDIVIDAVDSPSTKVFLNEQCNNFSIPLLHGACAGWYAQVAWIEPGSLLLKELYVQEKTGLEKTLRNASFTPTLTASIMVSEFVKHVLDMPGRTINQLVMIDLRTNSIITTGTNEWSR